ncbi:MAG: response regulator, partial [Gemmatimonadota bacterium]
MSTQRKILVVDDEPAIRRLLVRMLRAAEYDVDEAEDGLAAWQLALSKNYDLIVTDSHMPRMSGP